MKVSKLTVRNIGIIQDAEIPIDKPEIVFYGDIKQGKSTLLNAVRWVCGGAFPDDIIRHGETEASVQLEGTDGNGTPWCIRREWYRGRNGETKAREIDYTRKGVPVKKPSTEIRRHLNPFLLDQDYLRKMTSLERSRYLVELFAVDTLQEDAMIQEAESEASQLRIKIKAYGSIDLTTAVAVDVSALETTRQERIRAHGTRVTEAKQQLNRITEEHRKAVAAVDDENEGIRRSNTEVSCAEVAVGALTSEIADMEQKLKEAKKRLDDGKQWLSTHARRSQSVHPAAPDTTELEAIVQTPPDTSDIDAQIREAGAMNVRAEQYEKNKQRAAERAKDEKALTESEKSSRDNHKAKVDKLAAIGKQTGIADLEFTDAGFSFDGADSSMLSDSQIMRLSHLLSGKYPEGFGLSMIDRGESLGKSVLTLWEEAQQREATVLVTVVGDKPAEMPEQVGAYVVENGKVS